MSKEFTFVVEKECPVCGKTTRVIKVKSRLMATHVDNDYCCHYRGFDPYLYHIWVCEHCGFAADEKLFLAPMPSRRQEELSRALSERHVHFTFSEERAVPDGAAAIQLALFCAEVMKAPIARLAGITLRLAWIYRIAGQRDEEMEYIKKALELYVRSLEKERYPIDTLTDSMVMYLIGALYADLGEREKAVLYLSKLVGEEKNSVGIGNDKLYRDARRLWQSVREGYNDVAVEAAPDSRGGTDSKHDTGSKYAADGQHGADGRSGSGKDAGAKSPAHAKSGFSRWFG